MEVTVTAGPATLEEGLERAERGTLAQLEALRGSLGDAVEAATSANRFLAQEVSDRADELVRRHATVHEDLLAVIARQAPVATDLRLATALLHLSDRADRVAAQCHNIATLAAAVPDGVRPSPQQANALNGMAKLADEQLAEAISVFRRRDMEGAKRLHDGGSAVDHRNRRYFELAAADPDGSLVVALMARALERVGENALDIAQQVNFVATGRLHAASGAEPAGTDP
jgi:phosphate transport system protein